MNRQTTQEQLDDLLTQEIADDELRELLTRLGEIEFAWNPRTSIKDVVEATSADPLLVGRLLADIRKEDWEERFGLQVDDHEDRIERIEKEQKRTRRILNSNLDDSLIEDGANIFEGIVSRQARYILIGLGILLVIVFAVAFAYDQAQSAKSLGGFEMSREIR